MSFTLDVKDELSRCASECSHCDRAVLSALLRCEGTLIFGGHQKARLEFSSDVACVARTAMKLIHAVYNLKTDLVVRRSVLHKVPNYLIVIPSQQGFQNALVDLGILDADGTLVSGIAPHLVAKQCCAAAYLRGAFMGSGFVSNPKGDFHFEMTFENEEVADGIVQLMAEKDIAAHVVSRRNNYVVYLKSGTAIMDFLAFVGAHTCALTLENERVVKSVRNDVNRITNAEVANQAKSIHASLDQIIMIRKVIDHYGMQNLPPALQDFVLLRIANPEATLTQLGQLATPPLSKSAVAHRVSRLQAMADKIR